MNGGLIEDRLNSQSSSGELLNQVCEEGKERCGFFCRGDDSIISKKGPKLSEGRRNFYSGLVEQGVESRSAGVLCVAKSKHDRLKSWNDISMQNCPPFQLLLHAGRWRRNRWVFTWRHISPGCTTLLDLGDCRQQGIKVDTLKEIAAGAGAQGFPNYCVVFLSSE